MSVHDRKNLKSALESAILYLQKQGVEEARQDAWLLLEHVCGISHSTYFVHSEDEMPKEQQEQYEALVRKRGEHIPLQQLTRKSLRDNYGMVLQETWLRSGSIRDNIAMGKPDATDEEIIAAAKASHAHGFIKRLPEGYDTVIAEDGGNLSQGQKQLLCIARVMLCLPPMLILDEATSSIDTRTEIKIQNAFASFIVAHRLSTIREADIILVMKDGSIIEQGNHEELLEKNGFYAKLYNSQFAKTS